ncbi:MAG TPA: PilN domain-containing protein [Parasulfuritortus sp.]
MTAIRINLLPHREQKRALQQKALVAMLASAALTGLAVVVIGHFMISGMQDRQERRNQFLKQEIAKLDAQIKEIAQLKEKTNALLARKQVVEALQVNRTETVHLFDELARQLPDGMYLKSMKQTGNKLTLSGYAQSSARVSALMRNIENSKWLSEPHLIEVQAADQDKQRVNSFILEAKQVVPDSQTPETGVTPQKKAGRP